MTFLKRLSSRLDFNTLSFLGLLTWLVLLVLAQANPYLTGIGRDNGFFLYAGSRLLAGDTLYVDVWDHKGPLIFYINALGLMLIRNSRWGVWLLEYVFIFSAFFIGYLTIKKKWGVAPAWVGALTGLFALYQINGRGNLTEEYPLLFHFCALALFFNDDKRWEFVRALVIGALFSLAFLFRANNGGIQISIGLAILVTGLINRRFGSTLKRLAGLAVGVLLVLLLVALYFKAQGALEAMLGAAFTYNLLDTAGRLNVWSGLLAGLRNLGLAGYILLAGYAAALYKIIQMSSQKQTQGKEFEILALLVLAFPLEVVLSSLSGLNFVHYFICWVPVTFLLGSFAYKTLAVHLFSPLVIAFLKTERANYLMLVVTLLFSYTTVFDYGLTSRVLLFERQNGIDHNSRLADFIRETTTPDQRVLVWGGEAGLNFMTRRTSPTRYNLFSRLLTDHPMNHAISETFSAEVMNTPPELIIDMWKHSPDYVPALDPGLRAQQETGRAIAAFPSYIRLLEYINAHYAFETRIEGYEIYRWIR